MEHKDILKFVIVILVTTYNVLIKADYHLSSINTSWVNTECTMTSPPQIEYDPDKGYFLVKNTSSLNKDMTNVWIGYYQCLVGFEFIGCIRESDVESNILQHQISADPGHCFIGCGDISTVAVSNTTCFCLGEEFKRINYTDRSDCKQRCSQSLNVACGKPGGHLPVYRLNNEVTEANITTELTSPRPMICLTFNPKLNRFLWNDCYSLFPTMCSIGDERGKANDDDKIYKNWIDAGNLCFKSNISPVFYSKTLRVDGDHATDFWTGVFKRNTTFKKTLKDPQCRSLTPGILEYNPTDSTYRVIFPSEIDNIPRRALCEVEDKATTTTKTTTDSMETTSRGNSRDLVTSDTVNSDVEFQHTTIGSEQSKSKDFLKYGVPVGVSVIVAVVIVIIIIVILMKRRRRFFHDSPDKPITKCQDDKDMACNNPDYSAVDEHAVQRTGNDDYNYPEFEIPACNSAVNGNSNYYELEGQDTGVTTKQKQTYAADDNIYNTTNDKQTVGPPDDGNIYNKLGSDDTTYDTTGIGVKTGINRPQTTENAYNTFQGVNDDTYDSTISSQVQQAGSKIVSPQEDVYSHIPK